MYKTIRKNATKQIDTLMREASVIECVTRSSNYLTDGFDYSSVLVSENILRSWMKDNYDNLVIRLWSRSNGTKQECTFTCDSWSNLTFSLYFGDAYEVLNYTDQ